MLEERGHKFVRYADDCNICVKSLRAAKRVMEGSIKFLEGKLKLKVNRKKSATGSPTSLKFLGFSLYKNKEGTRIRVYEKPLNRLKNRLKLLTSRKRGGKMEWILKDVTRLMDGWLGYYSIADMKTYVQRISEWLRRRIRQIYWKLWKRVRTRFENLIELKIPRGRAWEWANSRKGYWRIAGSWILATTITNSYLDAIGFPNMLKRYEELRARVMRHGMLHDTC